MTAEQAQRAYRAKLGRVKARVAFMERNSVSITAMAVHLQAHREADRPCPVQGTHDGDTYTRTLTRAELYQNQLIDLAVDLTMDGCAPTPQ